MSAAGKELIEQQNGDGTVECRPGLGFIAMRVISFQNMKVKLWALDKLAPFEVPANLQLIA